MDAELKEAFEQYCRHKHLRVSYNGRPGCASILKHDELGTYSLEVTLATPRSPAWPEWYFPAVGLTVKEMTSFLKTHVSTDPRVQFSMKNGVLTGRKTLTQNSVSSLLILIELDHDQEGIEGSLSRLLRIPGPAPQVRCASVLRQHHQAKPEV